MDKKTVVIFGYGQRGNIYGEYIRQFPDKYEVVSIIENNDERFLLAKKDFNNIPIFKNYNDFLKEHIKADLLIVSTQDKNHKEHAIKMMENGYDLLLEKPIAPNKQDCLDIYETSIKYNRRVYVCHVLRYSPFYSAIKQDLDSGIIGRVIAINASENVGYYHFAHSYIRGPWRNEKQSSPLILAKCCHDMDIIRYLMGKKCVSVSSYGELTYFKKENAPVGSAEYCSDCKKQDCPFKAQKIYLSENGHFFANYFTTKEHTSENILNALKKTNYDKCVFKSDNDVVDHQGTLLTFEDGTIANHMVTAFSREIYRDIKIHGTKGELVGKMEDNSYQIKLFSGETINRTIDISKISVGKHNGSDFYMMEELYKELNGIKGKGITYLNVSIESHLMCFAAEESRLSKGQIVIL